MSSCSLFLAQAAKLMLDSLSQSREPRLAQDPVCLYEIVQRNIGVEPFWILTDLSVAHSQIITCKALYVLGCCTKMLCHGLLLLKSSSLIHLTITASSPSTAKFWWEALADWKLEDFSGIIYHCNWRGQNKTREIFKNSRFIHCRDPSACLTMAELMCHCKDHALESWQGTARSWHWDSRESRKHVQGKKSQTLTPFVRNYFPLNSTWYQKWLNTNPGQVVQRALSSLLCWRAWIECCS